MVGDEPGVVDAEVPDLFAGLHPSGGGRSVTGRRSLLSSLRVLLPATSSFPPRLPFLHRPRCSAMLEWQKHFQQL